MQAQIRDKHAALTRLIASRPPSRDLGVAFGEYAMLLQAAEFFDAAEPAYVNAQTLAADDPRWPYYLAHVFRHRGDMDRAVTALRRVIELRPDDGAALVWLGRTHLEQGRLDEATAAFAKAAAVAPQAVAARAGLGQTALARGDYARAAQELEAALMIDASAASLYAPLAAAYRGLGQAGKADALQKRWRNTDVPVFDPRQAELDMALESGLSYELRGVRALGARNFAEAARLFRHGLTLTMPESPLARSLHHKLGTALALSGDTAGGASEFEEVLKLAPRTGLDEPAAKASYSLGVLLADEGRAADAVRRLNDAVRYDPNYLEAHLALAELHRSAGRSAAARQHYQAALRLDPRSVPARDGLAMIGSSGSR